VCSEIEPSEESEPLGEPHSSNLPNCLSADLPISRLADMFGSAGASPSLSEHTQ